MQPSFALKIKDLLRQNFGEIADTLFEASLLLQYLNVKTKSANRGSKSRGSFASIYAIYVLTEDYIAHGYDQSGSYSEYQGAIYSQLLQRQRALPFGSKLQNHALNGRTNDEFKKYFPTSEFTPIIRDLRHNRYWINEKLLIIHLNNIDYNLARIVIALIDAYIRAKKDAFQDFISTCQNLQEIQHQKEDNIIAFIYSLLAPNVDARIFEIVSYSILKYFYFEQIVYIGFELDGIFPEKLRLYKTGRTNANDGGIDFVMKPLGRFFQVTETLDVKKYFLDIDKIEKYPITFVVKSMESVDNIKSGIEESAKKYYPITAIIQQYMQLIEEIINIPRLSEMLALSLQREHIHDILDEIVIQSKVEFNYSDEGNEDSLELEEENPETSTS